MDLKSEHRHLHTDISYGDIHFACAPAAAGHIQLVHLVFCNTFVFDELVKAEINRDSKNHVT